MGVVWEYGSTGVQEYRSTGVWEYGSWDAPNTLGEGEVLSTSISSPAPIAFRVTNKFPDVWFAHIRHHRHQQTSGP